MLIAFWAILGIIIGSFLNVCIDRLPIGKSVLHPPSHCDSCQRRLAPKDMVPVFSYLLLRGRCRYCQAAIPRRSLWVEIISGLLLAVTYWLYGLSIEFAVVSAYCCLFIVLAFIDLQHRIIPNRIVYPAMIVALVISILIPQTTSISLPWPDALGGVIGGITGFVFLLIPALVYRGGMGLGDVKMAALIGLITGFPMVFVSLLMGVILGGIVAGVLLLLKKKKRKDAIPFGPFLSLATIVTLLAGNNILNWYLSLF